MKRPGPGADVEHTVAGRDEAAEVVEVDVEALRRSAAVVEPRPLPLAELVEEGGRVLGS